MRLAVGGTPNPDYWAGSASALRTHIGGRTSIKQGIRPPLSIPGAAIQQAPGIGHESESGACFREFEIAVPLISVASTWLTLRPAIGSCEEGIATSAAVAALMAIRTSICAARSCGSSSGGVVPAVATYCVVFKVGLRG